MREAVAGISHWSAFSEEKGYAFNGYAVKTGAGTVVIDPPLPDASEWADLDALAPFEGLYVTNRNHARATAELRKRYEAPVRAHERDAAQLAVGVDETVRGGESIAGEVSIVHAPGKSPGEIAFYVPAKGALIVGDVVIGVPAGELSTYPDAVIDDRQQLFRSAAKLASLDFSLLLLCDGEPLLPQGRELLRSFVERHGDIDSGTPAADR